MAAELLILRHARSGWGAGIATDFERTLSPHGIEAAPRVGRWIAEQQLVPDYIFASPAVRTRQTLALLEEALGSETPTRWEDSIYEASLGELIELLRERPAEADRVLLLGHNPGLELLIAYLGDRDAPTPFPAAALAHFRMPDDWGVLPRGCAELVEIVRPRGLGS